MRQSVLPRRSGGSLGKVFDTVVIAMTLLVVGIAIVGKVGQLPAAGTAPTFLGEPNPVVGDAGAPRIPSDGAVLVLLNGVAQPVTAGSAFPIGPGLLGQATVSPVEGTIDRRTLDLALYQDASRPEAVTTASIQATTHMTDMNIGTFPSVATPAGAGHYLIPLNLSMSGGWQVDLVISTPTDHQTISLVVYAWS